MDDVTKRFIRWAVGHGWAVSTRAGVARCLPDFLERRYRRIPSSFYTFTSHIRTATTVDDKAFFICCDDYLRTSGVRWNEFELLSLDAAAGDDLWQAQVRRFWDAHLPILLSVKSGYCYYAIRLSDGTVISGDAPEFEETVDVAPSFEAFLEGVLTGAIQID